MDSTGIDENEPIVDDGAFWHTNMDLYYGFVPGELVEVEHEPNKYWLARIQFCYKHLMLLEWIGKYGEFWVEISPTNATTSLSNTLIDPNVPKRLFPLGHHTQPQLKSQFTLEKPTNILVAPSLYNPACDPYANIKNVDDLLEHEEEEQQTTNDDTNTSQSGNDNPNLDMICKKKIEYKQEDLDEVEAALKNIETEIEIDDTAGNMKFNDGLMVMNIRLPNVIGGKRVDPEKLIRKCLGPGHAIVSEKKVSLTKNSHEFSNCEPQASSSDRSSSDAVTTTSGGVVKKELDDRNKSEDQNKLDAEAHDICDQLVQSSTNIGRYMGIDQSNMKYTNDWFFSKPKQFYDMGGISHEKLFVPGTLLEVCHTQVNASGFQDLSFWPAYIIKNTGGRLTMRWFLCDEPKFKQGRLELKSATSQMIIEDCESSDERSGRSQKPPEPGSEPSSTLEGISAKSLTFSLHFCHPKIHELQYAEKKNKSYRLPQIISDHINKISDGDADKLNHLVDRHLTHITDKRRKNLDKDRPLIDYILTEVRDRTPTHLDIIFSQQDSEVAREVLVSCPKLTKLLKARIVNRLDQGVYEIHSYQVHEDDEIIKFIYPYDSSYAVLPLDWAINNEDCLSVDPSRNPTPDQVKQNTGTSDKEVQGEELESEPLVQCFKHIRRALPKPGGSLKRIPDKEIQRALGVDLMTDFQSYDVDKWFDALREKEQSASIFHCCIDSEQKAEVESRFEVMNLIEIVHPFSDQTICTGRIRKVVFPLLWVQLSADCYTMIPFNSTDIYPSGWCNTNGHKLVSMLPPRKRRLEHPPQGNSKKRKKAKAAEAAKNREAELESEQFNLGDIYDRQLDFDYILQEKNNYIKIYFNHKCFTGPSLSKSKICSLPQYVGPGPMHLVLEEVVTRIISVAYVPPRLLNELSSKLFEELLVERQLTNTKNQTFKAKYQKRVHRERVPVCLSPRDIALYCECICEHIKCCYNLFGPTLFDGDDCPSHCRSLTKSNKFMKRATYYREKARQGDYLSSEPLTPTNSKKLESSDTPDVESKTANQKYDERVSSDSTNSRSEQIQSRASSSSGVADATTNDLRESLRVVMEENEPKKNEGTQGEKDDQSMWLSQKITPEIVVATDVEMNSEEMANGTFLSIGDGGENVVYPQDWHVDDVARWLGIYELEMFQSSIKSEGIDGQALLLLDQDSIREHFQNNPRTRYSAEEVDRLWKFVAMIQSNQPKLRPTLDYSTDACRVRKLEN